MKMTKEEYLIWWGISAVTKLSWKQSNSPIGTIPEVVILGFFFITHIAFWVPNSFYPYFWFLNSGF